MGETGSSKKKEDMHMHKKQIALLMAGLMTVSSLTMGSVTVMADDDPVELYFMFNGPEYTDAYIQMYPLSWKSFRMITRLYSVPD